MSQPCSAVELVLFDARALNDPTIQRNVETALSLGVLAGAVLDDDAVANVVAEAGQADRLGFWFGESGRWPFARALSFASIEPGRALFVSHDPAALRLAEDAGLQAANGESLDIAAMLP